MKRLVLILIGAMVATTAPAWAQQTPKTPKTMVDSYSALADTVLAARRAEANLIRAVLDGHRRAAEAAMKAGDYGMAAAEISLFANEGDNAIGGIRKRLLEGGHHFNAPLEGGHHSNAPEEKQGLYEEGYVVVTRDAKKQALEIAKTLRSATTDEARKAAWGEFATLAEKLLKTE